MDVNVATIALVASLVLTLLNIYSKYTESKAKKEQELNNAQRRGEQQATQQVVTRADIDTLRQGNASMLIKMDKLDGKMDEMGERLARVEESAKSAHHRIDGLEGRPIRRGFFNRYIDRG